LSAEIIRWRAKAVVVSVAGLIFSLLLSFAILLGSAIGIPGLASIERAGVDASMRLFVTFPWITDSPRFDSDRYAFIDIDNKTCYQFSNPADCKEREPVPVAVVSDFLHAAKDAGAKIIIVDVLPDDEDHQKNLLSALQNAAQGHDGPWIIGLIPGRPEYVGDRIVETAELDRLAVHEPSRLRLASAITATDTETFDGIVRRYPILTFVKAAGSAIERPIPTVPFLAAMLAEPNTARAVDDRFYGTADKLSTKPSLPPKLQNLITLGQDQNAGNRIFYTLPGLSLRRGDAPVSAGVYTGRYDRIVASDLLLKGHFDIPPDTLRGRIVILGSSLQQAEDRHMTPIGPMSGAEVMLNATRAILEFSAIGAQRPDGHLRQFLRQFHERVRAAIIGFVVLLPSWFFIFWLNARASRNTVWQHTFRTALIVVVFCGALALALIIEVTWSVSELRRSVETGVETDMLTPIVALGLEGFAEAAKVVSRNVEVAVEWLASAVVAAATWVWVRINP